jgi:hypothetical protein
MSIPDTLTIDGEVYVRQTTAKEPESKAFPQAGDVVFCRDGNGDIDRGIYDPSNEWFVGCLKQGRIHRTEAEAIRANEVEAANAAIKRWRDENAPFVADWTECNQPKWRSKYDHLKKRYCATTSWAEESFNTIYFRTSDDLDRCQSELPDAWAALVGRQG